MIAYLDCVGGLAGDMLLAALLDAGAPEEALRRVPGRLGLDGVEIRLERVERHGIAALHVDVASERPLGGRSWRSLREQVAAAAVPERALRVLERLAEAEAGVHGIPVDEVQ